MERVYIFSGDCLSMGEVKLTQQRIRGEPGQVDVLSSEKCNSLQSGERLTIRELIVDLVEVEHQVIQDPKPSQLRERGRLHSCSRQREVAQAGQLRRERNCTAIQQRVFEIQARQAISPHEPPQIGALQIL